MTGHGLRPSGIDIAPGLVDHTGRIAASDSPEDLVRVACHGDPRALAAIRRGGEALGLGPAAVINLLNPSRLSVGG